MTTRRTFMKGLAGASVALPIMRENAFGQIFKANAIAGDRAPLAVAEDEQYWALIQKSFDADRTMINLNNGGVSPTPRATMDALDYYNRMCSEAPSYYMWRILDQDREPLRENLAEIGRAHV